MNLWFRFLWQLVIWRWRSSVHFFDKVKTPFRVWPVDLDANMHMNNGVYLSVMDLGRFDLMLRSGLGKVILKERWSPIVASQTIRYRRALGPFQKFVLETQVIGWDEKFFYLQQNFIANGEVAARATIKGLFLKASGEKVRPEEVLGLVGEDKESLLLPRWVSQWVEAESQSWSD